MSRRRWLPALVLAVAVLAPGIAQAQAAEEAAPLGVIKTPTLEQAKAQALNWLREAKADENTLRRAEAFWDPASDRPLIERVAETIALVDREAQELFASARDAETPAPMAVPDVIRDGDKPAFYRANLGLYYAKLLTNRKVYEQALEAIKAVRPEQVVDPASYYFFKAVCENKLENKEAGLESIDRLFKSVPDAPERYVVTANLMKAQMTTWKSKGTSIPDDLKWAARRMDNIAGRLDIARGGKKTQGMQKEVIDLLEEIIKKMDGT